ncbi:MAG TPA: class I SAM-dependent methyltransferase [Streptosporangiaceae bacterium]|nr:class I SAM-dependent methyltransferase [Streptosporangiaceae bacterium]
MTPPRAGHAAGWDLAYTAEAPAPWDIGRPQPAFAGLASAGFLSGQLLDAGCGTGEHSLLAAASGADVVGVDLSEVAIARARAKAAERGLTVRFEVASALELARLGVTGAGFDVIIDSGLFHVFDDPDRPRYAASLASVLRPGGTLYLMCFSDRQPGDFGPRRVSEPELRAAFADGWAVVSIAADKFELNPGLPIPDAQAWLATIRRQ